MMYDQDGTIAYLSCGELCNPTSEAAMSWWCSLFFAFWY